MVEDDPSRIERLMAEIATLRNQVAEVQSLRQAEVGVMEFLQNQTEAVDRDCIYGSPARPSPEGAPPVGPGWPSDTNRNRSTRGSVPLSGR